ncbi:MAG: hypothetical protein L3I99_02495 [Sulfurimonas sp.]|nr:hypothetical protein [Sulfurimonas sp.]
MCTKQFLELFNPYPGNHYLQVTTSPDEITDALNKITKDVDGKISLAIFADESIDYSQKLPDINIKHINNFKEPFRALPRSNDAVIIKDVFAKHENKDMLLKISYASLANTADIIIIEKKGIMDVESMKQMLQDYEFRAANNIDILDGYDLIMAKKMHMWGNGL